LDRNAALSDIVSNANAGNWKGCTDPINVGVW
jgi:hypothetical protein